MFTPATSIAKITEADRIFRFDGGFVAVIHSIRLDTDGSPVAYHPLNKGTTHLCNGLDPIINGQRITAVSGAGSPSFVARIGTTGSNPDFSISASPTAQTIAPGGSASFTFTVTPTNGFNGSVTLAASGLPGGASYSPTTIGGQGATLVTINTQAGSAVGAYSSTFTATSGSLSHQASLTLGINTPITGPSTLQANLGQIPIDLYDTAHTPSQAGTGLAAGCPSYPSIRACYQAILQSYRAQGVTGVRFSFTLCGGYVSTPLGNCGLDYTQVIPPSSTSNWTLNLKSFYQDIYNAGIMNVTPWMTLGDYVGVGGKAWGAQYLPTVSNPNANPPYTAPASPMGAASDCSVITMYGYPVLQYVPTLPYGQVPCHNNPPYNQQTPSDTCQASAGFPLDDGYGGYNCSPANPIFVGWNNVYAVVDQVIQAAYNTPSAGARGLNVFEFDAQQEIDTTGFPVMARFIVDNGRTDTGNGDVVNSIRYYMSQWGYDAGRVTWSAALPSVTVAGADCTDVYGDSARVMPLDSIYSAIEGGFIATPFNFSIMGSNLRCGGSVTGTAQVGSTLYTSMYQMKVSHSAPDIVDAHIYPCVLDASGDAGTNFCETTVSAANVQQEAQIFFNDVASFIASISPSTMFILGETHSASSSPEFPGQNLTCELHAPLSSGALTVAGFNSSSLAGQSVVFRPWVDPAEVDGCFTPSNQNVNVPVPGNLGPYTPTQH